MKAGNTYGVDFFGYDNEGLARGKGPCGYEVRVRGACRNERALVKLDHVSPHGPIAWGRIQEMQTSSPDRVRPLCRRSYRCGGCPWMHLSYESQIKEKTIRLKSIPSAMDASSIQPGISIEMEHSQPTLHYRNRAKYVLAHKRNHVIVGGYIPRSHRVISTLGCPVVETPVDSAARIAARHVSMMEKSVIYDEKKREGLLRYIGIRANYKGQVLLTLVASTKDDPRLEPLARDLFKRCPDLVGVTLDINDTPGNVIFSGAGLTLAGKNSLVERFGPAGVNLKGESFAQVNRHTAEALYEFAAREIERRTRKRRSGMNPLSSETSLSSAVSTARRTSENNGRDPVLWDLFCGPGPFTFQMERRGFHVLGVELDASSVESARESASSGNGDLRRPPVFLETDANTCVSEANGAMPDPDVVAVNPPRAGCSTELLDDLAALQPSPLILYVSCNPESLARDMARLASHGYILTTLKGFDMLPHTPHIEVVAVLEKPSAQ